jgi:hypothetical protein
MSSNDTHATRDDSMGELFRQLSEQTSVLVRQEVDLANEN